MVSIQFGGGKLAVKDEKGKKVEASRATVFLVDGNRAPIALIETAAGDKREVTVSGFDVEGAVPVVTSPALPKDADEPGPTKRR